MDEKTLPVIVPEKFLPVFLFWGLSWLALDSIGYWGIGRALWMLLGLLYSSGSLATASAEKTRNSPPQGLQRTLKIQEVPPLQFQRNLITV